MPLKDNIPTDKFPIITVIIIAINLFVFIGLQGPKGLDGVSEKPVIEYGAIPYEITHPGKYCAAISESQIGCGNKTEVESASGSQQAPWWMTIFTSMFMHGGWFHLLGNMLFLWIFGNNIEEAMGKLRFALFYLTGGIVALLAQVAIGPDATVPTIGASGAIAAVLGAYALLYPYARVLTVVFLLFFVTIIEIPALVALGVWLVLQFVPAFGQLALQEPGAAGGGIAYFAHIGGFLFGLAVIKLLAKHRKPDPRLPV